MSSYQRSYEMILDYLLQFSMSIITSDQPESQHPRTFGSTVGFVTGSFSSAGAQVGDLIRLTSTQDKEYRLGWLIATRLVGHDTEYLIQSLKTGKFCWWSNVGVDYFHRTTLGYHPEWKWTDEQHEFNDRWMGACQEYHDPYIWPPLWADFNDDGTVSVGVRMRHDQEGDPRPTIKLTNWQSARRKGLADVYLALTQMAAAQQKEARRVRDQHLPD